MIIIKTTDGDIFVNDKEVVNVIHKREEHTAIVNTPQMGLGIKRPPIEHVESVIYINEQTGQEWKDEGSQLTELKAKYDERMNWGNEIRKEYMEMQKENDQLKSELEEIKNRIRTVDELKEAMSQTQKRKISLRATSPVGSDCTQAFDVEGCDGMTVKDFILTVIKNDPFVTIDLMRDGKYIWNGEYNHQAPRKERTKELSEELLLLKIKSARAAGGYGRMSYNVKLY